MSVVVPQRQVRAVFDEDSLVVYQAYSPAIALPAVAAGRFVAPFSLSRMTWIKPSFAWMMARSGWAGKPGQEHVLAVRILRSGFEAALAEAVLSSRDVTDGEAHAQWRRELASSVARVQWDPERDLAGERLPYRSIQVGLSGWATRAYASEWIVRIEDVTAQLPAIRAGEVAAPEERPYPMPPAIAARLGMD